MVQVIVTLSAVPRQADEFIRALRSLKLAIQSVHGLACSRIYTDAEVPNSLMYVEEWRSAEDLGQDAVVAHFKRLFALMEGSGEAPSLRVASVGDACGIEQLSKLMNARSTAAGVGPADPERRTPATRQPDGGSS